MNTLPTTPDPTDVKRVQTALFSGQIRLDDSAPLYHAFLTERPDGVVDQDEARRAQSAVAHLTETAPKVVEACAGQTAAQAKALMDAALAA